MYSYRIEQAIRAASILHKDQVRKGAVPIPYISHVFAVAQLLSDYTENENVIISALLHDTIEDTDYTAEELYGDFGKDVQTIVLALSEPQGTEETPIPWRERKDAYIQLLKGAPEEALLVAAADKIHNMRSIIEGYLNTPKKFIEEFGGTLEERVMVYQKIANILNRNLNNDIMHEFNHVFDEYKTFIADVKKTKDA